jgi:plastocyanin
MAHPSREFALLLALGLVVQPTRGWAAEPAAKPAPAGKITGVIRFLGTVPPATKIPTTDGGTIEHSDLVVDARTKGLRDVAVVLEDAPAQPRAKKAESVVVDQRDMVFVPRVVAARHGQPVRFENSDLCNHNVRTYTTLPANDLDAFTRPAQPVEKAFEAQKHPIKVGCNLHPWMTAWVFVVPHPWVAVTDEKGAFAIAGVPPGKYSVWVRHPDTGLNERKAVEVEAGATAEVIVEWNKLPKKN